MRYQENLSGWIKAMNDAGLSCKLSLGEDRLASLKLLSASGLPTYQHHYFALPEFLAGSAQIEAVYQKYEHKVVLRACPSTRYLERYTKIGISITEAKKALSRAIAPDLRAAYTVVLNQYDPAEYCGVAIASSNALTIELVREAEAAGPGGEDEFVITGDYAVHREKVLRFLFS